MYKSLEFHRLIRDMIFKSSMWMISDLHSVLSCWPAWSSLNSWNSCEMSSFYHCIESRLCICVNCHLKWWRCLSMQSTAESYQIKHMIWHSQVASLSRIIVKFFGFFQVFFNCSLSLASLSMSIYFTELLWQKSWCNSLLPNV